MHLSYPHNIFGARNDPFALRPRSFPMNKEVSNWRVAVDSQCLTYLIDALEGISRPTDELTPQRIALATCFFYRQDCFRYTRTVEDEVRRMKEPRRTNHLRWMEIHFAPTLPHDEHRMLGAAHAFTHYHPPFRDCRILAECHQGHLDALVTFDLTFKKRLGPVSGPVRLLTPMEFLSSLELCVGDEPARLPHSSNPMIDDQWWRTDHSR
jgi:predicted nucleic acid-binding protein